VGALAGPSTDIISLFFITHKDMGEYRADALGCFPHARDLLNPAGKTSASIY